MNEKKNLLEIGSSFEGMMVQLDMSVKKSTIEIYKVENLKNNRIETLKIDRNASKRLKSEYEILAQLQTFPSFPSLISHSFGKSLEYLVHEGSYSDLNSTIKLFKILDLPTTISVFLQLLASIETIHKKFIIHGNISPKSILINLPKTQMLLSGFTESYDLKLSTSHKPRNKNELSCSFASLNSHSGALSYKDDLESLGYLLVYMCTGKLPWKKFFPKHTFSKWQKVYIMKRSQSVENLCVGCPKEFVLYFKYVQSLKEIDLPDYEQLKGMIGQVIDSKSLNHFMWDVKKSVKIRRRSTKNREGKRVKTFKPVQDGFQRPTKSRSKSTIIKSGVSTETKNQAEEYQKTIEDEDIPQFKDRNKVMESRESLYLSLDSKESLKSSRFSGCLII